MFQNKTNAKLSKVAGQVTALIAISLFAIACAPKPAGVRAQIKTGQTNMDPAISSNSQQQANVQGTNYQIRSISLPSDVSGGQSVSVELVTPNNQYLPLTTQHVGGALEIEGNYPGATPGMQVNVQARCSADGCARYDFLLTVSKGGVRVFQTGAISYKQDCKFYTVSIGSNVAQLFPNLASFVSRYNPVPADDGSTCTE